MVPQYRQQTALHPAESRGATVQTALHPAESRGATVQPNADRRQQEDSLNITSPSQHLVSFTLFLRSCHEVMQGLGGRLVVRQAKVGFCNYIQPNTFHKAESKVKSFVSLTV